jgi:Cdc6-like AAA superfamily ATPase
MACLLEAAAAALFPGYVPAVLPCRDQEEEALACFVSSALATGEGGTLALCGAPGVGKSATLVRASLRQSYLQTHYRAQHQVHEKTPDLPLRRACDRHI